jgi:histidinol dehydrogenase
LKIARIDARTPTGMAEADALRKRLGIDEGLLSAGAAANSGGRTPSQAAAEIIADVRARGDAAVLECVRRFDGVALPADRLAVSPADLRAAHAAVDRGRPEFLPAVRRIAESIRRYQSHILQRQPPDMNEGGLRLGVRLRPMARVGVYVPGGAGSYPSTVLMTVVPAQVAGVREIVLCSPTVRGEGDGSSAEVRREVLAVAAELGVTRVFRVGGVQAVAAMAFGTATVPVVDKIVGPGNLFVTLAKKHVYGYVDIDSLAGPSEVLVIADDTADAACVAADMLAQAEHDPGSAILVTPSPALADRVEAEIARQLPARARREALERALAGYSAIILTADLAAAVEMSNRFATEHLSVQTRDAAAVAERCVNAGAVFVGRWSPVAFGDYVAGPSHVLPTGGTARFAGGLTANSFLKSSSYVEYDAASASAATPDALTLADTEGFEAHGHSVRVRGRE